MVAPRKLDNTGTSAATSVRNAAGPDPPDAGPARTVLTDCEAKALSVIVPEVVIGDPIMVNNPVPSDNAMLVTEPPLVPVAAAHVLSPRRNVADDGVPDADKPAMPTGGAVVESPKGIPIIMPPYFRTSLAF